MTAKEIKEKDLFLSDLINQIETKMKISFKYKDREHFVFSYPERQLDFIRLTENQMIHFNKSI